MRTPASGSRLPALLAAFVAVSMVFGVLLAGLVLPVAGAAGSMTRDGLNMFNTLDVELADMPLPEGSTMYASDGKTVIARFYEENRVVAPLSKIAPVMRQAVVAVEDSRFYDHGGVDPKGLARAFVSNELNEGQIQGASTLTQQLVKNYLLESAIGAGDKEAARQATVRTKARKIKEIRMAIQYEQEHSKNEILEGYLNIANFGSNNYGVEAASQYFFQTTAAKLTLPQAALLAGLVQIPESYNPFKFPKAAKERRKLVLNRMLGLNLITQAQFTAADATPLPTTPRPALSGCVTSKEFGYFCDYAIKMLATDPRYAALGKDQKTRENAIKRGGYKIVTTVDAKLQKAATAALMKKIPPADSSGVAAVGVTVEPGTGKVLSIAQNKFFNPAKGPGQTEVSYGVDQAWGGSTGFQIGSTAKPYTLATWLSKGKGLATSVNGDLKVRPYSDFTACGNTLRGGVYTFGNSEGQGVPSIDVLRATYNSVNTAYVDIESRLDLCDIAKTAEKMGVRLSTPARGDCFISQKSSTRVPNQCPSLTLGAFEISPLTMANAYAVFAASGTYCPPTAVVGIKDRAGKNLALGKTACDANALPAGVAHGVNYALKRVLTQGTAASVGFPRWPAAGKTGTTDDSVRTWFVGYTKQRSTAVVIADPKIYKRGWDGGPGPKSLNYRKIGGTFYGRVYGSTLAAPLWRSIMTSAMKGLPVENWPNPTAKMLEGSGIKVADVTGRTIDEAYGILEDQGFKVRVGKPVPSFIPPDRVAKTSPPAGGRLERGSVVTLFPGDGSQPPELPPVGDGNGGGDGGGGNGGNGNGNGNGNGGGGGGDGRF
jgi:membrane peptidoglycan carboxypeptidase